MDSITETAAEKTVRRDGEAKLKSMETWENIQALAGNLMAAEELSVVFDANIKAPAHIDLQRRIVRVAQLDPSQKHLIPGLVFHEICHALWTKGNEPIDIVLNMIEDGYIERMGCKKYPGGKKHLRVIFNEFFDAKKVQKQGRSLVTRTLNTLNFNCKGIKFGQTLAYPSDLPPEIAKFLKDEVELTTLPTLKERDALAKQVKKLLKPFRLQNEMPTDISNSMPPSQGPGDKGKGQGQETDADPTIDWDDDEDEDKKPGNGQADGDDMNDPMNMPDEDKGKGEKAGGEGEGEGKGDEEGEGEGEGEKSTDAGEGGEKGKQKSSGKAGDDKDGDEDGEADQGGTPRKSEGSSDALPKTDIDPASMADSADDDTWLDDHLEDKDNGEVFDHHGEFDTVGSKNDRYQLEVASPEAVWDSATISDVDEIVEPNWDNLEKKKINRLYTKSLAGSKKVARLMYQRFLLTKNAHDAQKVSYRRSGQLDISRLPYYKTNDDLFITRRIMPKGKNHALVAMLDWSGSMGHQTMELWERTAEYVEFSRLAGVDVVVYTFTTGHWGGRRSDRTGPTAAMAKYGAMAINHGNFIRLIDTTSRSEMETQSDLRKFWMLANVMGGGRGSRGARAMLRRKMGHLEYTFGMGGTNIVEGHSFGVSIAKKLRKRAEKVSVIVVADGGDSSSWGSLVGDGATMPDDDGNMVEVETYNSQVVLHGKELPAIPAHLQKMAKTNRSGYWYTNNYLGERQRALLGQVQSVKALGITSVGIYLGSIDTDIYPLQAMPYEGNLIEWTDLGQGNSFIGVLIAQIS